MHWCHVSITTPPCWGSRLVALRARVVLAERIGAQPLSQCAGPGQPSGMACRGWPSGCMLGDGARGSASWQSFCDVICIWSIPKKRHSELGVLADRTMQDSCGQVAFLDLFCHATFGFNKSTNSQRFRHFRKFRPKLLTLVMLNNELDCIGKCDQLRPFLRRPELQCSCDNLQRRL